MLAHDDVGVLYFRYILEEIRYILQKNDKNLPINKMKKKHKEKFDRRDS